MSTPITTSLYYHYNDQGEVIYVGISLNTINRLSQHRLASPWFNEIASIKIVKFQTREEAIEQEADEIAKLQPKYNRNHKRRKVFVDDEELTPKEESGLAIVRRIVQIDVLYDIYDICKWFGARRGVVQEWIAEHKLGCIVLPSRGKHPRIKVTGWQLIAFLEHLESDPEYVVPSPKVPTEIHSSMRPLGWGL